MRRRGEEPSLQPAPSGHGSRPCVARGCPSEPAASAAAALTITSPARAAAASRAVVLTTSPSAVKSSIVPPGPVPPTNASPVWTAVPTGIGPVGVASALAARSATSIAACDRRCRVLRSADPTEEERDDLVADDLVDEAVVTDDRLRGQPVEVVEEGVELRRAHAFAHRRRAADVGEQQRDGHLDPAHPSLAKLAQALRAQGRIAGRAREPDVPEDEAADSGERRGAQLAARRGRAAVETLAAGARAVGRSPPSARSAPPLTVIAFVSAMRQIYAHGTDFYVRGCTTPDS